MDREAKTFYDLQVKGAKTNFLTFCKLMFPPEISTYGNNPVYWSKCHLAIIEIIQRIADRVIFDKKVDEEDLVSLRQCVSLSPQHGKSFIISILAPAWIMGLKPTYRIGIASFSYELATGFNMAIKKLMNSGIYREIFPETKLEGINREWYFTTSKGGWIKSRSVSQPFTGQGLDWLLVDDVFSGREKAESEHERKKVIRWFLADCLSRLSPKAPVFVTSTRWVEQDLIGYLTSEDYIDEMKAGDPDVEVFEYTNIPATCVNPDTDPLGRKHGEAAFPEWKNEIWLRRIKATMPDHEWESQFQGNPQRTGGGVADLSKIKYIEKLDDLPERLEWVRGYDLAASESELADYTASCKLAIDDDDNIYIADMWRNQLAWTKNQPIIVELAKQEKIRVRVEAVAGFLLAYQILKTELTGVCHLEKSTPKQSKYGEALPWLNALELGKLYLVRGDWNKMFKAELATFPDPTAHDDLCDATSVARNCAAYYRRREKKRNNVERPKSRMRTHAIRR